MRLLTRYAFACVMAIIGLSGGAALAATCTIPNTLTNGQVADATQVMGNFNSLSTCIDAIVVPPLGGPPQGRLTLTSNTPVMSADALAQGTIYYTPYQGNRLPVGSLVFQFSQLSYTLSSSAHLSGKLYDLFAYNSSGSAALCTGPAWSSTSARASAISMTNGLWSNSGTMTCTLSGGGSTTNLTAGQGTYLGTFYATANGQTSMSFAAAPVAGGASPVLGLYNAYNQVRYASLNADSTSSWTYNSTTPRATNNSANNRISWVDGLQQSTPDVTLNIAIYVSAAGCGGRSGIDFDTATAVPFASVGQDGSGFVKASASAVTKPLLGLHYAQSVEWINCASTKTFAEYSMQLVVGM